MTLLRLPLLTIFTNEIFPKSILKLLQNRDI